MTHTDHHRALAEKFMYKNIWEESVVFDSLMDLVRFAYTEEEAELVCALGAPLPARAIALKVRRPVSEVKPLLEEMARRNVIANFRIGGVDTYGFLPLGPGVFEAQMATGAEGEYEKEFARLFEKVYQEVFEWLGPKIRDKKLEFARIIPVDRSIDASAPTGVLALPSDRYREFVDRNKSFCLVKTCSCRHERDLVGKGCGKPKDVCSAMGWLADFAIEKGLARRVSKEEFLDAKERAAEAGLVNLVDNIENPMQVCSCCGCCCGALRTINDFNIPSLIAKSHFYAVVDTEKCIGCRSCQKICPMKAVSMEGKGKARKAVVDRARCIGCGVCVLHCKEGRAMTLEARPDHKPPAKTFGEFALNRYFDYKGYEAAILPRLSLGVGRLISSVVPIHGSGPKYRPPK